MRPISMLAGMAVASSLAFGFMAPSPASAQMVKYMATISPATEVPPVTNSKATGTLSATFDPSTLSLTYEVAYVDLTGAATAAHFHGPAPAGKNAPVLIPISGDLKSPIKGSVTLTPDQAKALMNGDLYFNIHTALNKAGEMRGQVEKGM